MLFIEKKACLGIGVAPGFYLYQGARLAGFLVQRCRFITKLIVGYFLPFIDKIIYAVCFLPLEFVKANCARLDCTRREGNSINGSFSALISELNNYEGKRSCQSLSWSVVDWYTLQLIVIIIIIVFGGEPGPKNKLLFRSANLMDHSALLYYPSKQFLYGGALNIWHLNYIDIFSVYIILLAFQLTSVR